MKGAAVAAAGAMLPAGLGGRPALAASSAAGQLVQQYYELIDAYQYADAYALLGAKWHTQQSEDAFTAGFANTAFVQCKTGSEHADGANTVVKVRLVSWHNDGKIVAYDGAYTVGTEGGKMLILAGDNRAAAVPAGTPPLCTPDELTFAFGPWDAGAGNRTGALVATYTGSHTCALGGSPRLELTDKHKQTVRSTSAAGSPPTAVVLGTNGTAQAPLRFANWCGDTGDPAALTVELPGASGSAKITATAKQISYPPCLGDQPALLEVKGWATAK